MEQTHNAEVILKQIPNRLLNTAFVYLAGSTIEGFGNVGSDIDVFVVSEHLPEASELGSKETNQAVIKEKNTIIYNTVLEELRHDFTFISREDFGQLITKLNDFNHQLDRRPDEFDKEDLDFLHRLRFSKMIKVSAEHVAIIQNINFNNLNFYLALNQSAFYSHVIEDLEGAYQSRDFGTCFFALRKLLEISATMFLALQGETNPNPKWLYRKLQRYCANQQDMSLLEKYMRLQGYSYDEQTIGYQLKETIQFCQYLNDLSQDLLKSK
ncbi:nucleotidyltransferase domain-containing protein [Paenibacillus tritici]|uniref:Nucleotidyltransferase domain-containing protein n=1 Tax=Paenibacillus tritici TaxID=1873425 RepID=A0ABX2DQN8_9BACL|nr:nucleotidyltransferase domain-containing protein [Paenibacillus tritici]NQX46962.1 nucleotidyltransferase domain-containing protein [Paenibacillus tritici]